MRQTCYTREPTFRLVEHILWTDTLGFILDDHSRLIVRFFEPAFKYSANFAKKLGLVKDAHLMSPNLDNLLRFGGAASFRLEAAF